MNVPEEWIWRLPPDSQQTIFWEGACAAHVRRLLAAVAAQVEQWPSLYGWGDGQGGWIFDTLEKALAEYGFEPAPLPPRVKKRKVAAHLRTAVFERDAYRCRACGTHKSLSVDHVVPESQGGETTLENLQTLCGPCNTSKGSKTDWSGRRS